jgi:gluconolactonase
LTLRVNKYSWKTLVWGLLLILGTSLPALAEGEEGPEPGHPEKVFEVESLEKLAGDFQFTEGPVWHPEGYLLFSDIPANQILKWHPEEGLSIFREPSHNSNGLTLDNEGRLLACEHTSRKVTRTTEEGEIVVLAEKYQDMLFNSPNDLVVADRGAIYFTDPPYGTPKGKSREMIFCGVFCIETDNSIYLEYRHLKKPNGIGLSPDEKTLYVADTEGTLNAFPVDEEGRLGEPKPYDSPALEGGDGLAVDTQGNVYATGRGGIWIYGPKGEWIGHLKTPEGPANCCFGGPDGQDFFITAQTSLYRIRSKIPGLVPGPQETRKD